MRFLCHIGILCIGIFIASAAGWSDTLSLADGERLSGKMDRIEDGVLVFHTSLSGKIMAPVDTVNSLSNEANLVVTMNDGRAYYGHFSADDSGQRFQPLDGGAAFSINLAHVTEALALPGTPDKTDAPEAESSWRLGADTGVTRHFSRDDATNSYTGLRVEGPLGGNGRLSGGARIEAGEAADAVNAYRIEAEAIAGETELRPFVQAETRFNDARTLEARTGLTLGLSHTFAESSPGNLEGRAGLDVSRARWDAGARHARESQISGRLELRFGSALFNNSLLEGRLSVMPSFTEWGDVLAESRTAFSMPVWRSLRLRLGLELEYDGQNALSGIDRWSAGVDAGLSLEF